MLENDQEKARKCQDILCTENVHSSFDVDGFEGPVWDFDPAWPIIRNKHHNRHIFRSVNHVIRCDQMKYFGSVRHIHILFTFCSAWVCTSPKTSCYCYPNPSSKPLQQPAIPRQLKTSFDEGYRPETSVLFLLRGTGIFLVLFYPIVPYASAFLHSFLLLVTIV